MNAPEKICRHAHKWLPRIQNAQCNQPADDDIGKKRVDIEADNLVDQNEQCRHVLVSAPDGEMRPHYSVSPYQFNAVSI